MSAPSRPLDGLATCVVGAGAVGGALARWLVARGGTVRAVAARAGSRRAEALASELGVPRIPLDGLESTGSDLLLLAVPDAALGAVAGALARRPQARVALHVAGAVGVEVLEPLARSGVATGGFHPLRAFAGEPPAAPPAGLFYAVGGAPEAQALARRLASAFDGVAATIDDATRPLYHLVATLLAGGVATVAAAALEIRRRAGLPAAADAGYARLALDALAAALGAPEPAAAITGPAARGDVETFETEARALAAVAPESLPLVVALARETLRQVARTAPSTPARERLAARLEAPELLDRPEDRVLTSGPDPHG